MGAYCILRLHALHALPNYNLFCVGYNVCATCLLSLLVGVVVFCKRLQVCQLKINMSDEETENNSSNNTEMQSAAAATTTSASMEQWWAGGNAVEVQEHMCAACKQVNTWKHLYLIVCVCFGCFHVCLCLLNYTLVMF